MAVVVVEIPMVADGEFAVGMEFSSRENVIMAMKDYIIRRGVDYRVYELEPLTFYAKCTQYGSGKGAWSPPRAFHMFCIRHIESNFLKKFKAMYLQKLVVNIGYSRTVCEYEMHYQRNIQVNCFDRMNEVFEAHLMTF
ncbi:hypothetical protein Ahy_B09g098906 [Arachis hypogaea]|uniref:Transposase MuDR plant domain-containing protein n=1 Tax=Arachis hypogaea TaxID=3818 RepID=A0A444XSH6_ARAHY|nr:hypothetical protein Ahy_B09g098906 [Arachis hypogaea]